MRQVFRKIPVYTGDVSGVCSALFELGGMVVMHDPSGCNSTYNTHDEIRWYDQDSLIFLSGLDEMDAIMGSDDRLIHDIVEAARIYTPRFIAVANSPIPYITGMDFDAICRTVEQETGIPSFYISTNGMHDYIHGAGLAFLRLADRFTAGTDRKAAAAPARPLTCSLLGLTPLDFANPAVLPSLSEKLEDAGIRILSSWAMEIKDKTEQYSKHQFAESEGPCTVPSRPDLLDQIAQSSSADVNLLLSSAGYYAAEFMYEHYGIPFVAGIPAAGVEDRFFNAVRLAVQTGRSQFPFRERREKKEGPDYCFIGEPVIMTSLAAQTAARTGCRTHVFGATEGAAEFLGEGDLAFRGEEELQDALVNLMKNSSALKVVADPSYADVLPEGCSLIRLPHLAFSGRIFLEEIPDLIKVTVDSLTEDSY